jgi:hypothetical protein
MKTPSRIAAALALSLCAVLVLALSAGPAAAERRAPKACETLSLVPWIPNGKGNGTAGSVYYVIDLTNSGPATCTLKGYPRIFADDLVGDPVGLGARSEGAKPKQVTLAPGAAAKVRLRITEAGNYSPSECHPVNAQGIEIRLPGQKAGKFVPLPFQACSALGESLLGTSAVLKG